MDLLTILLLMIVSFALAAAGARSLLGLVLRLMTQGAATPASQPVARSL